MIKPSYLPYSANQCYRKQRYYFVWPNNKNCNFFISGTSQYYQYMVLINLMMKYMFFIHPGNTFDTF